MLTLVNLVLTQLVFKPTELFNLFTHTNHCDIRNPTAKMVVKLYGSAMSFARVLVTILEIVIPYEHILIDIAKGDQKSEAYKKLQPFGKVPALEDGDFLIFESRAICKYLAR